MGFKFLLKSKANLLPKNPGVYAFKNDLGILYIGKAVNLRERIKNHFHPVKYREAVIPPAGRAGLFNRVKQIGYIKTNSEIEALILEANLIKKYQPKYNIVWRDDKNYFFVGITKEDFPRIFWTHQTKPISNFKFQISNFTGPFVDGTTLKQTLKILRKVCPFRSCKTMPKRPCLWYQLSRCPAPCLLRSNLAKEINLKVKLEKECKENAKNLMKILQGKKTEVLKNLEREMKVASKNQGFERAAKIRGQISSLKKVLENAKIFKIETLPLNLPWQINALCLKEILKTEKEISRIEAYDVSNIVGQQATGSMITFINGKPDKNFYRRFRVKIAGKPDDIAMIKECLIRRIKHSEWPYPDLILIDGGKAQLNAAKECLRPGFKRVAVMALAKRKNELYLEGKKRPILLKTLPREIFNLILQLRDEAHRFALAYHKKLREIDTFN